jgi:hypothetical protein
MTAATRLRHRSALLEGHVPSGVVGGTRYGPKIACRYQINRTAAIDDPRAVDAGRLANGNDLGSGAPAAASAGPARNNWAEHNSPAMSGVPALNISVLRTCQPLFDRRVDVFSRPIQGPHSDREPWVVGLSSLNGVSHLWGRRCAVLLAASDAAHVVASGPVSDAL